MADLDTKLLRGFILVAESGSMTQTARKMNQTQSAVSQQIKRLECVLGRTLFLRSGSKVTLTGAGREFLPLAKEIVATCDAAFSRPRPVEANKKIRFGMPHDLVSAYFSPTLDRFSASFPDVYVELHCEASPILRKMVDEGTLDLAMIEEPVAGAAGDILRVEPLVWFGKLGGQAYAKRPLPVSLVAETCAFRPDVHEALEHSRLDWRSVFEAGDINATMATVRGDMAVSAGLKSLVPPDLCILAISDGLPDLPMLAITLYPTEASRHVVTRELSRFIWDAL
jgi:DNA-binding transcriptional LysR family regulator